MTNIPPIAIIGMGCRLPGGAESPEELWDMLYEGRSGHGPIPTSRWNADAFYHPDPRAKESIPFRHGHFLHGDVAAFDARFFGIPPGEAKGMDPQQRLLLEVAYEAIENAGIPLESLRGSATGVFMAEFARDYDRMMQKDIPHVHKLHVLGCGDAILSNRISYLMDFKGPSFTLDTGCSGSMVAIHQACQSLRTGESSLALAGGGQLILHPDQAMNMSNIDMMNPDGKCYVFDDRGRGYGRGEGFGAILLKRLDDALRDGDHIHAVIPNSGVNQDGKTVGISLPSGEAQGELARSVYAAAGLDPGRTLYVEAHGTGTQAGDQAEVSSICKAFCENTKRDADLYVGSIKANIGHLECASGISAIIKSVMMLKKGWIPANINLVNPKPSLHLDTRPIKIPTQAVPLAAPDHEGPRRISVSGFGYGGTNAHVILESMVAGTREREDAANVNGTPRTFSNGTATNGTATLSAVNGAITHGAAVTELTENGTISLAPNRSATINNGHGPLSNGSFEYNATNGISHAAEHDTHKIYFLSAASEASLRDTATNLAKWLSSQHTRPVDLPDLSYTLATRRSLYEWRSAIVSPNITDLIKQLGSVKPAKVKSPSPPQVTFIFTGQGAQWHAMGRELIVSSKFSKVFHDSITRSSRLLKGWGSEWSLEVELLRDEKSSRLGESQLAQPATTAVQIALVDLLSNFGVMSQRVCGHSSGEIGAAYAAGCLSHEAALKVSYLRGICCAQARISNSKRGSMLAVGLGEDQISVHIKAVTTGKLVVACVNSPESTTISGDEDAIDELATILNKLSVFNRKLKVDTAYHSHHMMAVAEQYVLSMKGIEHSVPQAGTEFFSSVTGEAKTTDFGPGYWTQNLVSPVQFDKALRAVAEDMAKSSQTSTANVLIEIGPHSALQGPSRQVLSAAFENSFDYSYLSPLVRKRDAIQATLEATARLFEAGYKLSMEGVLSLTQSKEAQKVIDNLPPYPWDHSTTYWHESRLSRNHRLRQFPYHDLVGVLDVMGDIQSPRWRHYIGPESMPWLRDHVVDGLILFPGTGYIAMAIEAINQLVQLRQTPGSVGRFVARDVVFKKSLVVPEPHADGERQEVEVQITLTPEGGASSSKSPWEVFRVVSYDAAEAAWTEHCTGLVCAEMEKGIDQFEVEVDNEHAIGLLQEIEVGSTVSVDVQKFYDDIAASGNVFGPTFRAVQAIKVGDHQAHGYIAVPDIAASMPAQFAQPHIAHPATLDALNHVAAVLYQRHCENSPFVAASIDELSVSATVTSNAGAKLVVASRMKDEGGRSARGNTWVFQDSETGMQPIITISGWRLQAIGEARPSRDAAPFDRDMTYRMEWRADVDHLSNEAFISHLSKMELFGIGYKAEFGVLGSMFFRETAALIFIRRAVRWMEENGKQVDAEASHLPKLYEWMRRLSKPEKDHLIPVIPNVSVELPDTDQEDFILAQAARTGAQGEMLVRIGNRLPEILSGRVKSLSLMFEDNLLDRLYAEDMMQSGEVQMAEYVKLLSFKNSRMRILEIGAGTGGASLPTLQALDDAVDGLLFDRYCYTDISSGFFEKARVKFAHWEHRMDFKTLDVSKDPLPQGFEEQQFDIIIAANVLHATPSLDVTVANCRKLLKPGGRMILMEVTRLTLTINTIFGTLPGWWMSEDGRKNTPTVPVAQWDEVVRRHGFEGVEIATPDHQGETAVMFAMVCKAVAHPTEKNGVTPHPIVVLSRHGTPPGQLLSDQLCHSLGQQGLDASSQDIEAAEMQSDSSYIVLDTGDNPLLKDPSPREFIAIQRLATQAKNVLWVSTHSSDSAVATAAKGMINGLARVARHENPYIKLVTLDVRDALVADGFQALAENITGVASASFWPRGEEASQESEYAIESGQVLIPRVRTDAKFNRWVASTRADGKETYMTKHRDDKRPIKLWPETPGLLNTLRFVDDEVALKPLAPNELELRAMAYGVNFKDVFVALGQQPPGAIMAGETAGIVTAVGSDMKGLYQVGDRVAGLVAEPYASHPRLQGLNSHALPDSVSFIDGASAVAVFSTAWYCLVNVANLRKGESVLIHSGSGGVGQAAIQIAQHLGAVIYATVGSAVKRDLLVDTYSIPPTNIFASGSTTFKDAILHRTNGRGVDVVLNSLSGEQLKVSVECTAEFGRFVEIGKSDIFNRSLFNMASFDRGISVTAVDFSLISRSRQYIIHDTLGTVFDLFNKSVLRAVSPVTTFSMDKVEEAFRLIAGRKHLGKLVMLTDENTMVRATVPAPEPLKLAPNAAYVVVGGLGDLGRRVCLLLARAGAGHIVTLSRTVPTDEALGPFRQEVEKYGAVLHTRRGDVTDASSVLEIASFCRDELPTVKGVIHSGLALSDRPLELMTLDEYQIPLRPKVNGTLNLHTAFSKDDLDFFIMLSSSTGIIGAKGQANYAAGNTFQDAFADAQNAKPGRTRYVSLDIGAVAGSGHIARLPMQGVDLERQSVLFMTFEEVDKLLEYAMGPLALENDISHCMAGFDREAMITMQDLTTLNNPMFSLLPTSNSQSSGGKASGNKQNSADLGKLLQAAKTLEDAEALVLTATAAKFSVFLDREVPIDVPTVQLATDSLVSIELKNWMSRTFQAPIQASEIAGSLSITAISKLLVSRSKLVSEEVRQSQPSEELPVNGSNGNDGGLTEAPLNGDSNSVVTERSHGWECCKHSKTLPKQPLVELDDALDYLLENFGHFYQPEGFKRLKAAADELRQPGEWGQKVYAKLAARYNDPNLDSWIYDLLTDAIYLKRRYPLAPYASFVGSNFDPPTPHTQSERAAVITLAAFAFRDQVAANKVEPHWYYGMPTCTSQLKWLFDACREPGISVDSMKMYPDGDYIAVLRRGHVFKVELRKDGLDVSYAELKATFDAIIELVKDGGFWTGILTSDNRDSWAELRAQALALSPLNVEYFKAVEESSFVVCLDDNVPETDSDQVRMAWFGDGFNRWADKCTQVIITANGKSSVILEHGAIDGLTSWRFSEWVQKAILAHQPEVEPSTQNASIHGISLQEVTFQSNPDLNTHMSTLRERYIDATSTAEYMNHTIAHFGTDDLMSWAVPVKSVLDATVQLAIKLHYGRHVPCWEGVSMSHYHKGRNDMLQVCLPSVVSFCAVADDESVPLAERRASLLALGRDMSTNMQRCLAGRTHLRFLELMRDQWPADQETPLMFREAPFWLNPFCILQHVPAEIAGSNMLHGVQRKDCFFISVTPFSNSVRVAIDGTTGNTEPFARCLNQAALIMKQICQGE